LAAATFGAEFTGPLLPDEPDPDVEPEPPLLPVLPLPPLSVLPLLLPEVDGLAEEVEAPSDVAAGLDSPPSDLGLFEE
jgi:hypothetical protein